MTWHYLKKNAYKKYVEECWGAWIEEDQQKYFENFINEYQGKGIGTKILKDILEKYNDTDIEIQYFKQNPVGVLYERLGFEKSGETNFHYQMRYNAWT